MRRREGRATEAAPPWKRRQGKDVKKKPSTSVPRAGVCSRDSVGGMVTRAAEYRPRLGVLNLYADSLFCWELIDPRANDFEPQTDRVGPLRAPDLTILQAFDAMQDYQTQSAQRDSERFGTTAADSTANNMLALLD